MTYQPQSSSCQHLGIAHSDVGNVVLCPECGVVRISMEHMSIRLLPEVFRSLAHMLNVAQARIDNFNLLPQMPAETVDASQVSTPSADKIH